MLSPPQPWLCKLANLQYLCKELISHVGLPSPSRRGAPASKLEKNTVWLAGSSETSHSPPAPLPLSAQSYLFFLNHAT